MGVSLSFYTGEVKQEKKSSWVALSFYIGQTKKEYTEWIKEDLKTLQDEITTLDDRIDTKIQTVKKNWQPSTNTRTNDYIFKIIE